MQQPAPLTWKRLLPLDVSWAFLIIAVMVTLCLSQASVLKERAHLSGLLSFAGSLRLASMERIAHEGVLTPPSPQHMGQEIQPPDGSLNQQVRFRYRHEGTSVIATGTLRPQSEPFTLSFHPAVMAATPGWSVIWLCGVHQPPRGWSSPATGQADNLLPGHLPSACKANTP